MKAKFLMIFALGIVVSVCSAPLLAHHGNAAYDADKKITIKGTVTQWIWSNPHCMLQFDVTDDSGQVVHWIAETENPSTMSRNGWTEKSFKSGDQVTVTAIPLKNHNPVGRIIEVVSANGERLAGIRIPQTSSDSPALFPKQ
jgi:hypothetical protein